jgi:hypothetical protein
MKQTAHIKTEKSAQQSVPKEHRDNAPRRTAAGASGRLGLCPFLEIILSYGSFPVRELVLASRR